ncbi:MAG: molybdopterin dinucleotide binding domain-containing protein, partial [Acidimicrobiales bacterium]|nr:molybdopterin dinucleotide binding domain-containing protein [Acidimicrobiales bacterium]
ADAGADDRPGEAVAAEADAAAAALRADAADDPAAAQQDNAESVAAQSDAVASDEPATGPQGGPQATSGSGSRPPLIGFQAVSVAAPPAVDAYSLRLVATRKMYDLGTSVQRSPSLAGLAPGASLRLHPYDFDRVGVPAGTTVTVSSPKGSVSLPVFVDEGVARGAAAVYVNQPGAQASVLIDATATVNDVRVVP